MQFKKNRFNETTRSIDIIYNDFNGSKCLALFSLKNSGLNLESWTIYVLELKVSNLVDLKFVCLCYQKTSRRQFNVEGVL